MKKALLPALIAGIFAVNGALAADRELLFGPAELTGPAPTQKVIKRHKVSAAKAPVVAQAAAPKAPVQITSVKAPIIAVAAPVVAQAAAPEAPAKVVAAVAPVMAEAVASSAPAQVTAAAMVAPAINPYMALGRAEKITIPLGADPSVVREQLISKLKTQVTVGFFPSAIGGNGSYSFLRSFLPLANHLSAQTGVLVNFVPQRDLKSYGVLINESRFPVIFINALLAREAIAAGYKPLAVGKEELSPGYVVQASSPFKKIEDIKDAKLAWSLNAQTSLLAMSDVTRLNLTGNTFEDVGQGGRAGVLSALTSGAADVGVWRANEMEKVVAESNGKLRLLGVGSSAPSSGLWVRGDLYDSEFVNRLTSSLLSVSPESKDSSARNASLSFTQGFGLRGQFVPASTGLTGNLSEIFKSAQKSFPGSFNEIVVDENERLSNMARAVTSAVQTNRPGDTMTERDYLVSKLKSQITVGFFPSATGGNGSYAFLNNFMPLSNYLSKKTGVLLNFVPERNLPDYGRRIGEYRYPVVFINALLTRNAIAAGYVPLVVGKDNLAPGFMVRADSPIKKIEDIKDAKVAWSLNAQTSLLTMADVSRLGLTGNTYSDVGSGGRVGALSALSAGTADVAVWRSNELEKISDPKLRYLGAGTSAPSSGVWIRKDLAGTEFAKSLEVSLLKIEPDSTDTAAKNASLAYARGFGLRGQFAPISKTFLGDMTGVVESAKKAFPSSFEEIVSDAKERETNMARQSIESVKAKSN